MSKPLSSLPPGVEHRLAAWEQVQYRLGHEPSPRIRPTITLSRQFGCEAFPVSERLKAMFEEASGEPWNIYDRTLIERVSTEQGISIGLLRRLGEMSSTLDALGFHPAGHTVHDRALEQTAKYVVQIAKVGNAIVVGRGGALLCRNMKNCFHFRLEASHDWRVASMMRRLEIPRREAEEIVKGGEKQREKFITRYFGENIADRKHYHAVFDNERQSANEIAAAIMSHVRAAWPEKEYFKR